MRDEEAHRCDEPEGGGHHGIRVDAAWLVVFVVYLVVVVNEMRDREGSLSVVA